MGKDIYKTFLKGYITKEWKREDEELPPFIFPYLPLIYRYDTSYLNDTYIGIPVGCYNALFNKLLNDREIILNVDFLKNRWNYTDIADKIRYTGRIDEYFNFAYTQLDYKTLKWDTEVVDKDNEEGSVVIRYYEIEIPYIRSTEYKHFEPYNKKLQKINQL